MKNHLLPKPLPTFSLSIAYVLLLDLFIYSAACLSVLWCGGLHMWFRLTFDIWPLTMLLGYKREKSAERLWTNKQGLQLMTVFIID